MHTDEEGYIHRYLWCASDPLATFGAEFTNTLLNSKRVILYDSVSNGGKRPDVIKLTLHCVDKFKSDAVFITSNPKLTTQLVKALQKRGLHAFGPVFDS